MSDTMRLYAPEECNGVKGYPPEWHATIKHQVREEAGHRCVRCRRRLVWWRTKQGDKALNA